MPWTCRCSASCDTSRRARAREPSETTPSETPVNEKTRRCLRFCASGGDARAHEQGVLEIARKKRKRRPQNVRMLGFEALLLRDAVFWIRVSKRNALAPSILWNRDARAQSCAEIAPNRSLSLSLSLYLSGRSPTFGERGPRARLSENEISSRRSQSARALSAP